MNSNLTAKEEVFRDSLRQWLEENLLPEWRVGTNIANFRPEKQLQIMRGWQKRVSEGGWCGIAWPKEYGGRGATLTEQMIFYDELARVGAPTLLAMGLDLVGPAIIRYGSEGQKQRYLKRILSAEEVWCQGFSEPDAGSDLAALQTRAVLENDHFIVTGQKVWTSYAHYADFCMLLARTDPDAPKHRGISALIVDMKSPGIRVQPLVQISGAEEFNEVFLDGVHVPRENLIGELNHGWELAMTVFAHERGTIWAVSSQPFYRSTMHALLDLARKTKYKGRSASSDPIFRQKLAQSYLEVEIARYMGYRSISRAENQQDPGPYSSISKLFGSALSQRMHELALEIEGPYAQLTSGSKWSVEEGRWQFLFLDSRGATIAGGTSEIQRNIVGERILGLPRK